MHATRTEQTVRELLSMADIEVGGGRPWDMEVRDDGVYRRLLTRASLGLGETYVDGGWNCERVDELVSRVLRAGLEKRVRTSARLLLQFLRNKLTNPQTIRDALEVGRKHYDIGNDLYEAMLDQEMTYTCGYWQNAATLDEAQQAKLNLVCEKIGLEPGMRVLDIGCGWGAFARHAARRFGAKVVGITISREQAELARRRCQGLPIEIRFQDYRRVREKFDRIVSLGMFEHVGSKNYRAYMYRTHDCLEDGGIAMLQTIAANTSQAALNPWIEKYIFPRGKLPSLKEIAAATEGLFVIEDCHNFGADYDRTLMAWHRNFNAAWDRLRERYGERFRRMWNFYLLSCAGSFRARDIQLWQIVISKGGVTGGYRSIR
jgi:cyclopropane-fatty-acyl-phospholipid synthase